jgi:hypothetical protein
MEIILLVLLCTYFVLNGMSVMYVFDDKSLRRKNLLLQASIFIGLSLFGAILFGSIILYVGIVGFWYWFKVKTQIKVIWGWYFTDKFKIIPRETYIRLVKLRDMGEMHLHRTSNFMERVFIEKAIKRYLDQNPILLHRCKIWVGDNIEDNVKIQRLLIDLGCYWQVGNSPKELCVKNTEATAFFIDNDLRLTYGGFNENGFKEHHYREIEKSELLCL